MSITTLRPNAAYPRIFQGRVRCAGALKDALTELGGRNGVTEAAFQTAWLRKISDLGDLTEDGLTARRTIALKA